MVDGEPVVTQLHDFDPAVRRAALAAFRRLPVMDGRHLPQLMYLAQSRDDAVRALAILAIAELGPDAAPAARVLREALASKDRPVADAAVRAVEAMGQSASLVAPGLIDYIRNNGALNDVCVRLLARIGDAQVASDLLDIARLDKGRSPKEPSAQRWRVDLAALNFALRQIAERDTRTIPLLEEAIEDQDSGLSQTVRWILDYSSQSPRARALQSARHDQARAERVIPILLANLESHRSATRIEAALDIAKLGARAAPAGPALTESLRREPDWRVRCAITLALGQLGPCPEAALPLVRKALSDDSDWLTLAASLWFLGRSDARPDARVRRLLTHESDRVRLLSTRYVGKARDSEAIPRLILQLEDPDDSIARTSAWALGCLGPAAVLATEHLVRFSLSRPKCNRHAMAALHRIAPAHAFTVSAARMKHPNRDVRRAAVQSFAQARTQIPRAIGAVAAALADESLAVRSEAVESLRAFFREWRLRVASRPGAASEAPPEVFRPAVPRLVAIIASSGDHWERQLRPEAAYLLECLAPLAADAVPDLVDLLPDVRAMRILGAMGPAAAPAVPALIEALNVKHDHRIARAAVNALAGIGPSAREAIPALFHFTGDPDLGPTAVWALHQLDADPDLVVPVMLELIDSTVNLGGRRWTSNNMMVGWWAKTSDEILPALIRLKHVAGLRRFGPAAAPALPMLIDVLQNGRPYRRIGAARTLAAIGPKAKPALDALWKALEDPSPEVRKEARRAIVAIESSTK
jgi:HEAT repeat protein